VAKDLLVVFAEQPARVYRVLPASVRERVIVAS